MERAYRDFRDKLRRGAVQAPAGNGALREWQPTTSAVSFFVCLANAAWGKPAAYEEMRALLVRRFVEILVGAPVATDSGYREALVQVDWEIMRRRPLASSAVRSLAEAYDACNEYGDSIEDLAAFQRACLQFVLANERKECPVFQAIPLLFVFCRIFGRAVYLYDVCPVWDHQHRVTRERVQLRPRCDPIHTSTFAAELEKRQDCVCLLRTRSARGEDKDSYSLLLAGSGQVQETRDKQRSLVQSPFRIMWYTMDSGSLVENGSNGRYLIRMSPAISRNLELVERRVFGVALPTEGGNIGQDTVFSLSCDPVARSGPFNVWVFAQLVDEHENEERLEFVCQGSAACFTIAFSLRKWQTGPLRPQALFVTSADSLERAQEQLWVELNKG